MASPAQGSLRKSLRYCAKNEPCTADVVNHRSLARTVDLVPDAAHMHVDQVGCRNYKFVPATNLVDVHMGRVRHKVDGPGEVPMIYNVRGAGFILRAVP